MSQELPFYSIPPAAEHYTAANSISRMIEGLGFRYYWATEGLINGPITDAIYHTGQVVSFRRTSGNPIPKGVNVFLGVKN